MSHDTQDQFQKHLDKLDRDLSKFDLPAEDSINLEIPPITKSSLNQSLPFPNSTNPKIFSQLPTLSPSPMPSPNHPYHVLEPTLSPLNTPTEKSNLADTTINLLPQPTWKRIPRADSKLATSKTEVLGLKRAATHSSHQSELSNMKHVVSQLDMDNTEILAEASSQPCQKQ